MLGNFVLAALPFLLLTSLLVFSCVFFYTLSKVSFKKRPRLNVRRKSNYSDGYDYWPLWDGDSYDD